MYNTYPEYRVGWLGIYDTLLNCPDMKALFTLYLSIIQCKHNDGKTIIISRVSNIE